MSDAEKSIIETEGSRDEARKLLFGAQKRLFEAAQEIEKLHQKHPKDISYRRTSAHISAAVAAVELARIEVRKRKLKREPKVEVPTGGNKERIGAPA